MKWTFQPVDSWFFRESRPWSTVGGIELASQFPPPARTVAGAIRTAIGEAKDVDWLAFSQGRHAELRRHIGSGVSNSDDPNSEFGSFRMHGPYVERDNHLVFPAPAVLLRSKETGKISLMHPAAKGMRCDLGSSVRLPHAAGLLGAATLDGHWCTAEGLNSVLRGDAPPPESLVDRDALVADDARVGIARDNSLRTVHDGLLYQTSHVRLRPVSESSPTSMGYPTICSGSATVRQSVSAARAVWRTSPFRPGSKATSQRRAARLSG